MTREEQFYARKFFQLEIHRKNGQAFEDFFTRIMQLSNINFLPVKPQGKFGDRKNDGFIKSEGKYYQVYSPEEPNAKEKAAIKKLVTDFKGLYDYWNEQVTPIKEFHFVVNDKYHGTYPTLHPELEKIEQNHKGVKCFPFFSQHLEDRFLSLPVTSIEDILGPIVVPENIQLFDSSVMNEVIKHLLHSSTSGETEKIPENPAFDEKLTFNGLSSEISAYLKFGSYQEGELKNYFRVNSAFAKAELQRIFNHLYKEALIQLPESLQKSDLVFFYIIDKAHPKNTLAVRNALYVLMAYFFSYCDIFEEPVRSPKLF